MPESQGKPRPMLTNALDLQQVRASLARIAIRERLSEERWSAENSYGAAQRPVEYAANRLSRPSPKPATNWIQRATAGPARK